MAQAFVLKTDVAMAGSNVSQKQNRNHAVEPDDNTRQSFSSALDKLVEKQDSPHDKKLNKTDKTEDKVESIVENKEIKADKLDEKGGKLLPDEAKDGDDSQIVTSVEAPLSPALKGEPLLSDAGILADKDNDEDFLKSGKLVSDTDALAGKDSGEFSPEGDVVNLVSSPIVTDVVMAGNTKEAASNQTIIQAQIEANNKIAADIKVSSENGAKPTTAEQEDLTLEQKQLASSLRTNIVNSLLKKPTTDSEKLGVVASTEQKLLNSSTLTPIIKGGLSEEQKMMALMSAEKSNVIKSTSPSLAATLERGTGVSAATFSPSAVNTNGASNLATPAVSGQPSLNLQPAITSEAWGRVLSSRVIWMAREGVQQASLKMNPANMGPVEVKLHMHNDQASVSFIAHHAATRDALEQALPRLRESFQENGLELANADVSQQHFSQADEQDNNQASTNGSISSGENGQAEGESIAQDATIAEDEIELGLSVFA